MFCVSGRFRVNVHNLMEEFVYTQVNDLFDTASLNKAPWLTCTCAQCRLDTMCYVLNRIPPRYIKSGRGLVHTQIDDSCDRAQLAADISRIGLEGMKQVLSTKRPHTAHQTDLPDSPVFNFPTFVGRILDGQTFEPLQNISVLLLSGSKPAVSIDSSWENPYVVSSHTPGTFTFWVRPEGAPKEGIKKVFSWEIRIEKPGYDTINHFFELGITSESVIRTAYSADHAFILPDLHLFPVDSEEAAVQSQ